MVYLLHFAGKLGNARHYIGFTTDERTMAIRMKAHRAGTGGRLPNAMRLAGIDFVVAKVWPEGDQAFERKLKRKKRHPNFCPLCHEEWRKQETKNDRARRHRRAIEARSQRTREAEQQGVSLL